MVIGKKKLLLFLLALCLVAGCANSPESVTSPAPSVKPLPESVSQREAESLVEAGPPGGSLAASVPEGEAKVALDQAETRKGMDLFALNPDTGEREPLLENLPWNGEDREAVSPSGNRVLTSSRMGGLNGGWCALLSLYDIGENRLANLEPPPCELWEGGMGSFHAVGRFRFWDEDNLFYDYLFPPAEGEQALRLLFYQIGEDGSLAPKVTCLEAPPLAEPFRNFGRFPNTRYLADQKILIFPAETEAGPAWLAWELEGGRFLGRAPAENAPEDPANAGILRKGHLYGITENFDQLTFDLWSYEIAADTMEVLGSGPLILADTRETEPSPGWLRPVHLAEVRSERVFRLQAGWPQDPEGYWEALWDRDEGGPIRFTKYPPEAASPVVEEGTKVLATLPDGRLLILAQA